MQQFLSVTDRVLAHKVSLINNAPIPGPRTVVIITCNNHTIIIH